MLETRQLLASSPSNIFSVYTPQDLAVTNPISGQPVNYSVVHQLSQNQSTASPLLTNVGKILSGKDRAGDEWTLTVHGPGYAVVTDTSPNDGKLDDNLVTIQLVGTNINSTYVTGNVTASDRVQTSGTIPFQQLVDQSGVKSIILNGFDLEQTVAPAVGAPNNTTTGVQLYGGVQYLQFHNVVAPTDTATADVPISIQIGDPSTPLPASIKPSIVLNSIQNTVFDGTATTPPALTPQTSPTVNIIVNGQIQTLSMTSAAGAIGSVLLANGVDQYAAPAQAYFFPTVATTGRTSVQAIGINNLYVYGAATNLTASRTSPPFQNGFTGLNHLTTATFNGPTDAVGLDVNGPVGTVNFLQGAGNATNVFTGTNAAGSQVPASQYGVPADQTGYAGAGLVSAQVTATSIKKVNIKSSTVSQSAVVNPDFVQINGIGTTYSLNKPGVAAVNTLIASSGNIGATKVTGSLVNSEIKSGFNYQSFAAGLEGTRAASTISPLTVNGSLVNSVVSATVRPVNNAYSTTTNVTGPGTVTGNVTGPALNLGGATTLGNTGAGVYAKVKVGNLPTG